MKKPTIKDKPDGNCPKYTKSPNDIFIQKAHSLGQSYVCLGLINFKFVDKQEHVSPRNLSTLDNDMFCMIQDILFILILQEDLISRSDYDQNCAFIHSLIHSIINSFNHSFIHSFIHLFFHQSIQSFIHSFIHSFTIYL